MRVTRRPHTCVRLQPSAPRMHAYNAPRFRRHRRGHHVLRHRCEQSTVSPTESAARKRAAATAVAGGGVTQTGAEAPSPEHLVGRRPHMLTRSCTWYNRALTQGTQMLTGSLRGETSMHYTTHAPRRGERHANDRRKSRRLYCAACGVQHVAAGPTGRAICILRRSASWTHVPPCSGYHPMGSRGVVEPGARAVGANGIERCPPHVYP